MTKSIKNLLTKIENLDSRKRNYEFYLIECIEAVQELQTVQKEYWDDKNIHKLFNFCSKLTWLFDIMCAKLHLNSKSVYIKGKSLRNSRMIQAGKGKVDLISLLSVNHSDPDLILNGLLKLFCLLGTETKVVKEQEIIASIGDQTVTVNENNTVNARVYCISSCMIELYNLYGTTKQAMVTYAAKGFIKRAQATIAAKLATPQLEIKDAWIQADKAAMRIEDIENAPWY